MPDRFSDFDGGGEVTLTQTTHIMLGGVRGG